MGVLDVQGPQGCGHLIKGSEQPKISCFQLPWPLACGLPAHAGQTRRHWHLPGGKGGCRLQLRLDVTGLTAAGLGPRRTAFLKGGLEGAAGAGERLYADLL